MMLSLIRLNCGKFYWMLQLDKSYVSLDLGGGSTQITFAPKSNHVEGLEGRKHFMHEVNILQNMIKVRNKKTSEL